MSIDKNGGIMDCRNKMGENVAGLGVADDGGGILNKKNRSKANKSIGCRYKM